MAGKFVSPIICFPVSEAALSSTLYTQRQFKPRTGEIVRREPHSLSGLKAQTNHFQAVSHRFDTPSLNDEIIQFGIVVLLHILFIAIYTSVQGEKLSIYPGVYNICLQKIVPQVGGGPLSATSGQILMAACNNTFLLPSLQQRQTKLVMISSWLDWVRVH